MKISQKIFTIIIAGGYVVLKPQKIENMLYFCYFVLYALVFITGACIGSFLNVCIYRLPKEESLIKKNSHCMTCGAYIKRRDLIPIVSWLILKGKCRNCGSKISTRYTFVEFFNAVIYLTLFIFVKNIALATLLCLLFSALIVVFFTDIDTQTINIYNIFFIALLGIPKWLLTSDYTGISIISQLIGIIIIGLPFFLIVFITAERAMGLGDAYLMAAAGFFLGAKSIVVAAFIGLVIGCIAGLIHKKRTGDSSFAFGPYLAIGIATASLVGENIADMYLSLINF